MKRALIIFTIILVSTTVASAQQRGESYFGFNAGYSTGHTVTSVDVDSDIFDYDETSKVPGSHQFSVGLEYGYFVANNLLISANVSYGLSASSVEILDTYSTKELTHTLTITPGISYYVRLADRFYYTPRLNAGFVYGAASEDVPGEDTYTVTTLGAIAELQPFSVEFRPSSRFAMHISLGSLQYTYLTNDEEQADFLNTKYHIHNVNFSLLSNAEVGFKFYF